MKELKNEFIKYCSSYASKQTVLFYKNVLTVFDEFLSFDNIVIDDINVLNASILTDFISYLRFVKEVKNVSCRTYLRGLRVFLNWCYDNGYMLEKVVSVKLPKDDRGLKVPLSRDEVRLCYDYIDTMDYYLYVRNISIFDLMLCCGLRSSEVRNLQLNDFDYKQNIIRVNNSKNNKSRVVPVPFDLKINIQCYIDNYRDYYLKGRSKWLFLTNKGDKLEKTTIDDFFRKIKVVCPRIHPHLLRHTFATSYIMGGGSLEVLRVLLGHTSYNVTQGYISLGTELSISHYDIYRIDDVFFDKFSYRKGV